MNKFIKSVKRSKLYQEYIRSINGLLNLTEKEILVLTEIIQLDVSYVKLTGIPKNVVNTVNRRYLISKLGISKENLSRMIRILKNKQLLIANSDSGEIIVNRALIPDIINDRIQVTMIIKIDKNDK
ncbi:transcriptional regulator [uncultured phage cr118_1]|jgi:hypothetical protein|uniref:Transcriptional regulator n=1 Tax=uncultured phage cr118_1 TaxID=2772063 RepID=A0A7M1RVJ0_9CAUD|nr:transcriptional regulator [uncultured phage cr118_1]QOR58423.1 transcriptional regulator [uncultured phage cr118_1]DAI23361.1 MAG TPA: chromosome replication initiation protein [Caudoviricetes sp.]